MRPLLGTFVEIAACNDDGQAQEAIRAAFAAIAEIQQLLSFQQADSELSRLNAIPGCWLSLSQHSLRVLKLAKTMMVATDHRFNCTVGGALIDRGVLPNHGGRYLTHGTAEDIEISRDQARLARPVRITLDGIAKGFAVDRAIAALKKCKVRYGWVNAGGDLRVFGDCTLPVNQRRANDDLKFLGGLRDAALATSHNGSLQDKERPGLIVNTEFLTKRNSESSTSRSDVFSVIARYAWRADALTKVAANTPTSVRAKHVAALGGLLIEDRLACAG